MIQRQHKSTIDGQYMYEYLKELKNRVPSTILASLKVYDLEEFRMIKKKMTLSREDQYELGVKKKCLIIGMGSNYVEKILGQHVAVINKEAKECRDFADGHTVIMRKGELVGYTTRNRIIIERDVQRYFSGLVVSNNNE